MERWNLLDDGPASGAVNMAADEFLFDRAERYGPLLRLYSFEPPALTVGFHQSVPRVLDVAAIMTDRLDVVRRVTGGRVLLHAGELTYCVVVPRSSVLHCLGLRRAFREISRAIVAGLRSLGVDAAVAGGRRHAGPDGLVAPCLTAVSLYEVSVAGRKIVCSAQRRAAGALLQHGSILREAGSERVGQYLRGDWTGVGAGMTTISREIGGPIDGRSLRRAVAGGFAETFGVAFRRISLTPADERRIARRAAAKSQEFSDPAGFEEAG